MEYDADVDAVTPCADPSFNGTIVVTSSYIETRFVSPRHEGRDVDPEADVDSEELKKVNKTLVPSHFF